MKTRVSFVIGVASLMALATACTAAPDRGTARTVEIFGQPWSSVLCSHRPVIPGQLTALRDAAGGPELLHRVDPGGFFVFHRTWLNRREDTTARVVAVEQHDVPPAHD